MLNKKFLPHSVLLSEFPLLVARCFVHGQLPYAGLSAAGSADGPGRAGSVIVPCSSLETYPARTETPLEKEQLALAFVYLDTVIITSDLKISV